MPANDAGSSGASDVVDSGASDASLIVDAGQVLDAGLEDAGVERDAGSEDAGASMEDAGMPDASMFVDAGTVNSSPGQCGTNTDCPTNSCTLRTPGGFCAGCSDDGDCPSVQGVTFTCNNFGTCNQDCESDADCPTGLHCHSTQFVCVLKSCGTCPALYVCDNGYCSRPPCDSNCPSGKCNGGYCIVDR